MSLQEVVGYVRVQGWPIVVPPCTDAEELSEYTIAQDVDGLPCTSSLYL